MTLVYPQFPRLADIAGGTIDAFNQSFGQSRDRRNEREAGPLFDQAFGQYLAPQQGGLGALAPQQPLQQPGQQQAAPNAVQRSPLPGTPGYADHRVNQAHGLQSLIQSESGGRWNAQNNAVGAGGQRGHYGRLQFGHARLADAKRAGVIPANMTPEQFMASPEVQQRVEQWHFADIDREAQKRGLMSYVGQNVGGATITPDGIRNMAHLGGIAGAERYLKSGGRYNPADANGTRLSDYARMGSGGGAQQALESMAVGETTGQAPMQGQQMAQMGAPAQMPMPDRDTMRQLFANPVTRPLAIQLAQAAMQQHDPMQQLQMQKLLRELSGPAQSLINAGGGQIYDPNSGQWITAPGAGASSGPAAFQTLQMRAQEAGLQPGTPEYQEFMAAGGRSPEHTAAAQRISRMTENLMATGDFIDPQQAQNVAEGIVDGRLRADRHPVTGELQVVDMATGRVVYGRGAQQQQGQQTLQAPSQPMGQDDRFGRQFPAASESFGIGGAAQSALNTLGDVTGVGAPYPEVQQTQADFNVLRESLLNDMGSAYNRQPPSWLMQEIRSLTPQAGSVFEGAGGAQTKLRSLGRHMEAELRNAQQALNERELSPANRQEMEARVAGLRAGLARVTSALESFGGPAEQAPAGAPEPGTIEDGYRFKGGDPANPENWERVQ